MSFYQVKFEQTLKAPLKEVWDFIAAPENLKKITPDYMGFDITSKKHTKEMYPGMVITYKVSPLFGIKMNWMTEITHVKNMEYFVDQQRVGPYSIWHHQHHVTALDENTTQMIDILTYKPPFGFIGAIANSLMIKSKLKEIFNYRKVALDKIFNTP